MEPDGRLLASTGPRSFERGESGFRDAARKSIAASTGPRSFERGESRSTGQHSMATAASTGPRSFERGERAQASAEERPQHGFNGAALFRARRDRTTRPPPPPPPCFNGAALFRARREQHPRADKLRHVLLQRGRALSSAERSGRARGVGRQPLASTGPRSFERGEAPTACGGSRPRPASTGPRSFERGEMRSSRAPRARATCFNGAALFRARREMGVVHVRIVSPASTGPRSFERGEQGE